MLCILSLLLFMFPSYAADIQGKDSSSDVENYVLLEFPTCSLEELSDSNNEVIQVNILQEHIPSINQNIDPIEIMPEELILSIFLFCEKMDLINCSLVSQRLKSQVRRIIPGLTLLPTRPSCLKILDSLRAIESCEAKRPPFMNDFQNIYQKYLQEIQRLGELEERVRYSPYFIWHQGSQRIQTLLKGYDLDKTQYSMGFSRRILSSFTRDPYILPMTVFVMTGATTLMGWFIANGLTTYRVSQDYHDNYKQSDDYKAEYARNLAYAQSGEFMGEVVDTKAFAYPSFRGFGECYKIGGRRLDMEVNSTIFCHADPMIGELNTDRDMYEHEKFINNFNNLFAKSLLSQEFNMYFDIILDVICKKGKAYGRFVQRSRMEDVLMVGWFSQGDQGHQVVRTNKGMTRFLIQRIDYHSSCIAEGMTIMPEALPYPGNIITIGAIGIVCSWLTYIFVIVLGWGVFE